jgi:hypothetical protein
MLVAYNTDPALNGKPAPSGRMIMYVINELLLQKIQECPNIFLVLALRCLFCTLYATCTIIIAATISQRTSARQCI